MLLGSFSRYKTVYLWNMLNKTKLTQNGKKKKVVFWRESGKVGKSSIIAGECIYRIGPNYKIRPDFSMVNAFIYIFFDISGLIYSWKILATCMLMGFFTYFIFNKDIYSGLYHLYRWMHTGVKPPQNLWNY